MKSLERMTQRPGRRPALLLCLTLFLLTSPPAWALRPDQIALVANRNVPQSLQLANYYMAKRNIPQGRIILLDLPVQEQLSYSQYRKQVIGPARDFLRQRDLEQAVTCLVTFYGVPLRITARPDSEALKKERAELESELGKTEQALQAALKQARDQAAALNVSIASTTMPGGGDPARQAEQLLDRIWQAIGDLPPSERAESVKTFAHTLEMFGGPAALANRFAAGQINDPHQPAADRQHWQELTKKIAQGQKSLNELSHSLSTPQTRLKRRRIVNELFGPLAYRQLLNEQLRFLNNTQTAAAFDSELALLWWNDYPHARWLINPLHYGFRGKSPPVLMVMRLDAPTPGIVRNMILAGLKAEHDGLKGRIVLDSRGIAPVDKNGKPDGYGQYDQTIRNLAHLIQARVKGLPLSWDDRPALFPPHSLNSVALYCGWYSVRHYIPSFQFNLGAVGFHVASYELVSLRSPHETGWVHGLLNNGVVATLGAVAEPYLSAFPRADDFFPLLLTGKLPLAEVYWKTIPMTSWMMSSIGDPLYTPFKNHPALKVQDLPQRLQAVFKASSDDEAPRSP